MPMLIHTHRQPASPTSLGKELIVFIQSCAPNSLHPSVRSLAGTVNRLSAEAYSALAKSSRTETDLAHDQDGEYAPMVFISSKIRRFGAAA